jgi:hypothetical protein
MPFINGNIDIYSAGPLMTGTTNIIVTALTDNPLNPWSGSYNINHFFTSQEFFYTNETGINNPAPTNFTGRLLFAGAQTNSYDRYTFYRMLAQLGTDSAPEQNKININYLNVNTNGNVVPGMETNLISWSDPRIATGIPGIIPAYGESGALVFFTDAAQAMFAQLNLRDFNGNLVTVTNIPLYPTNYYTPAVHRVLQLAANIFDSTTNQTVPLLPGQTNAFLPSVFRPFFRSVNNVVSIAGYIEVTNTTPLNLPFLELRNVSPVNQPSNSSNIYGVPWVIGAKKGFPNFNEFALNTTIQYTRRLMVTNNTVNLIAMQEYMLGISNQVGVAAWNSYLQSWPASTRPLEMRVTNDFQVFISNQTNQPAFNLLPANWATVFTFTNDISINNNPFTWPGYNSYRPNTNSLYFPIQTNYSILTNSVYWSSVPQFRSGTNFELITLSNATPQVYIMMTNRVRYALIDTLANRVVDFVNLDDGGSVLNLTQTLTNGNICAQPNVNNWQAFWCPAPANPPISPLGAITEGLAWQIGISEGNYPGFSWASAGADPDNKSQIQLFSAFLNGTLITNYMQAPFDPTFTTNIYTVWSANDPLVHYTIGDLTDWKPLTPWNFPATTSNPLTQHYRPWGKPTTDTSPSTQTNTAIKDPQMVGSDSWDLPTNKFPNIGWLGRVHRGTPWQTVYLKSTVVDTTNTWMNWSGDITNYWPGTTVLDASFSHPVNDRQLFNIFTTAINDNATHGQLSVNQTNLAAWSAVLSGVIVLTNNPATLAIGWTNIQPAGVYNSSLPLPNSGLPPPYQTNPLVMIWQGINNARANVTSNGMVFTNQVFAQVGDILATPQLTDQSPFINTKNPTNDEVYERIPQQIMSLLTFSQSPRFVVYSYGQTLHPAVHSLVNGGAYAGLCTNYQITAETATRAVVRVDGVQTNNPHIVIEQFNVLPPD